MTSGLFSDHLIHPMLNEIISSTIAKIEAEVLSMPNHQAPSGPGEEAIHGQVQLWTSGICYWLVRESAAFFDLAFLSGCLHTGHTPYSSVRAPESDVEVTCAYKIRATQGTGRLPSTAGGGRWQFNALDGSSPICG